MRAFFWARVTLKMTRVSQDTEVYGEVKTHECAGDVFSTQSEEDEVVKTQKCECAALSPPSLTAASPLRVPFPLSTISTFASRCFPLLQCRQLLAPLHCHPDLRSDSGCPATRGRGLGGEDSPKSGGERGGRPQFCSI